MARELIIPKEYPFSDKKLVEVISPKILMNRVQELAKEISNSYKDSKPILIGVLNGAFIFMADLVRNIEIECEIGFIKISSYGNQISSTGKIKTILDLNLDIKNRDVIIVEDIIDSGNSVSFLKNKFENLSPKSVKFATCLYKNKKANIDFKIDWIGFKIDDSYFVGYGLDLMQNYRGLQGIYKIEK